jgi:hypothetical protein
VELDDHAGLNNRDLKSFISHDQVGILLLTPTAFVNVSHPNHVRVNVSDISLLLGRDDVLPWDDLALDCRCSKRERKQSSHEEREVTNNDHCEGEGEVPRSEVGHYCWILIQMPKW